MSNGTRMTTLDPAAAESPAAMPSSDMARPDDMPEADDFQADRPRSDRAKITGGMLLILLLLLVAAGVILTMRMSQKKINAADGLNPTEVRIDQALARLANRDLLPATDPLHPDALNALFSDTDRILELFGADLTRYQVPIQFIQRNPFQLPEVPIQQGTAAPASVPVVPHDPQRVKALQAEYAALDLQMVVTGKTNVALIDGQPLKENQRIGSFLIESISAGAIRLVADGKQFTLIMTR